MYYEKGKDRRDTGEADSPEMGSEGLEEVKSDTKVSSMFL